MSQPLPRHNRYFVMRHGRSLANERGVVISHPKNGVLAEYGLSEIGRDQARESARSVRPQLGPDTVIYSSDFSRARQTAAITRQALGAGRVHISRRLRERHFGDWEHGDNSAYQKVWDVDRTDPHHQQSGVESAQQVRDRVEKFTHYLERRYRGRNILLVSHGDTLQILQTLFEAVPASHHRSLRHLETAEIRSLT